jgi:DtxR family Mn-dependent transcriptional regulator
MLQKLAAAKPALVWYRKHQGARLTAAGTRAALEVIRHHRLMETWLAQTLGYTWDQVHGEAEALEHAVSEDLEKRISAALGNPVRDPHGEPIPSEDLIMPADRSVSLSALKVGEHAIVRRVQADDTAALKHLDKLGLRIGSRVTALSVSEYDALMVVRIGGVREEVVVGPATTGRVFVEPEENGPERR